MENQEDNHHHHRHPDTEIVGGGKKSVHISFPDDDTAAAAREDITTAQSAAGDGVAEPNLADGLKKVSSFGSSVVRNASARIKQVPQELTRRPHAQPSGVVHALKGLEFISKTDGSATWDAVEKRFHKLTLKTDGLLPRSAFGECIGMHKEHDKEFSDKLVSALARRTNISGDSITKAQLKEFWDRITNESFDCRLEIFFDMIDKDADGKITEDEVREIISSSASSNGLSNIKNNADEYARTIMEYLDPQNLGYVMVKNLEMLLLQGPDLVEGGGGDNQKLSKTLTKMIKPLKDHRLKRWRKDFQYFLLNNWQRIWLMTLWIGVMAGLFAYKYIQYRDRAAFNVMGHCVCMAKGAAETLKLNMALILLPMCRKTITWLRNKTVLGSAVPFDDNINFHKVIAAAIGIGVGIHGISHLACDFPRLLNTSPEKYEPMRDFFGDQPTSYWHFVKGWEGVTGIVMVVLMAIAFTLASPCFRRNNNVKLPKALKKLTGFNAFWYSHHLFIIVYAALIIHGIKLYLTHEWYKKTTWMYLAIPITIYAGERLIRHFRSRIKDVKILKVALYPENVLALHMSKPQGFEYESGQYIFVNCAAVSPFEWHPFSITSAPGDDYLSVHIRIVGDWTGKLRHVLTDEPPPTGKSVILLPGEDNNFPRVLIDGPYGAPTQDYKDYEVVLLIGLGIGATPMISVLKDIINNIKAMDARENALEEGGGGARNGPLPPSSMPRSLQNGRDSFKLRRVYFYWVTKKQCSFEWFKNVMNEVAESDHNKVIEMHSYCASVYKEEDARSAPIAMLQSINLAKNGVDVVSETRVKSYFGKPKWSTVYEIIAKDHPNSRVGVFYCGPPQAVKQLKDLASDFSHDMNNTTFEFHKENF